MKKILLTLSIVITSYFIADFLLIPKLIGNKNIPAPTEILQNKQKRKEFKKHRKEYMEQMHRAHPDDDWRKIDAETRKQKTIAKTEQRQELLDSGFYETDSPEIVRFGSRDIEGSWAERGSNNLSGRIVSAELDFENDLIYCASCGGNIWRGTINGENWESLNDYFQILDIKMLRFIDTGTTQRLLIGTGSKSFYYTDDEAFTITETSGLTNLQNWGWITRTVVKNDDSNTIYILAEEWDYSGWAQMTTLHKSIDYGESFTLIHTLTETMSGSFDIWTPRYAAGQVYLQNDNDIYIIDENDEITPVGTINTVNTGSNILIGGTDNGVPFLYARVGEDIFYSSNAGHSWQWKSSTPSGTFTNNSFNCSNITPQQVYIGQVDLYRSSDGASSWQMVNNWWEYYGQEATKLHADIPEVRLFIDPNGDEFAFISTDGGIYVSDDYVQNVNNLSLNGLGVSQYYSTYSSRFAPYNVYAGSQDQGYQRCVNDQGGILDFEQVISGDYGHLVSGNDGESIWCDYPGFVLYYPDAANNSNGLTWDFVGSNYLWLPPLTADPNEPNICLIGGGGSDGGGHIIRLDASHYNITHEQLPFNFGSAVSAMAISPIDPSYRYVLTTDSQFFSSSNSGDNWELSLGFTGPGSHYFYGSTIHASAVNLGTVYIGGSGYSNPPVFVSENHGSSFTSLTNGIPSTLVFELKATLEEDVIFAATEVGPYAYLPAENLWYDIAGTSAPDQTYWTVDYIPELATARFGTYGRGIWDFTLEGFYWIELGDVNQDEIINVVDIILLINIILENTDPTDEMLYAGDLNSDGLVNIMDIILIVNIILGI